ncbi:MAG: SelB C-terminal domain-containing protein [Alphaproteobacteria bacterium]
MPVAKEIAKLLCAEPERVMSVLRRAGRLRLVVRIDRNVSVEILEYLDRVGMIRREGEGRRLLRLGRSPFWPPSSCPKSPPSAKAALIFRRS